MRFKAVRDERGLITLLFVKNVKTMFAVYN